MATQTYDAFIAYSSRLDEARGRAVTTLSSSIQVATQTYDAFIGYSSRLDEARGRAVTTLSHLSLHLPHTL